MSVNKQELILEATRLSKEYQTKKDIVLNILNDLDKENGFGGKHVNGMSAVNELMQEMGELEQKHSQIIEQIKK
jgi:hypothetical protein